MDRPAPRIQFPDEDNPRLHPITERPRRFFRVRPHGELHERGRELHIQIVPRRMGSLPPVSGSLLGNPCERTSAPIVAAGLVVYRSSPDTYSATDEHVQTAVEWLWRASSAVLRVAPSHFQAAMYKTGLVDVRHAAEVMLMSRLNHDTRGRHR